jgi:16S rRNA (uracil1498-N3)-methyltransferase
MTVPRFFIPVAAIDAKKATIAHEDERLTRQINNVLRLKAGDRIDLLDGLGSLYHCRIESAGKRQLKARIEQSLKIEEPDEIPIHVGLPLLKGGRFEWALEKLTELGVAKISPILVTRSVVKADLSGEGKDRSEDNKLERWLTILKEAAEQCERATIPRLVPPRRFALFLQECSLVENSLNLICAERRQAGNITKKLDNNDRVTSPDEVAIAVGAEGGFTGGEVEEAIAFGFTPISLGHRILRSETAAIYALAIVASKYAARK